MSKRLFASESPPPFPWEQDFTDHFQRIGHNEINQKSRGQPSDSFLSHWTLPPCPSPVGAALFSLPPALNQLEVVEIGLEGGGRAGGGGGGRGGEAEGLKRGAVAF